MKLKCDFVSQNISGEGEMSEAMVGLDTKVFNGLVKCNQTAATIMDLLKEEITRDQLINEMCNRYEAPRELIERDEDKVLEDLKKCGAL